MYKGRLFRGALYAGLLFGAVIAVELPPGPAAPYQRQPARAGQKVTLKAYHRLGTTTADLRLGELISSHASVVVVSGEEFTANFGKLGVSTAARVALIPVDSALEVGHLVADGRRDISDEELVALIMEILDV